MNYRVYRGYHIRKSQIFHGSFRVDEIPCRIFGSSFQAKKNIDHHAVVLKRMIETITRESADG